MLSGPNKLLQKLGWLTPIGPIAGRWRRLGVALSFAAHLSGLGLFMLGLILIEPEILAEFATQDIHALALALLAVAVIFLFIELCYLLIAMLTMCWGAGVEPWGTSFSRTLSRWYQLTPWHALLTLGFILAQIGIEDLRRDYYTTYYSNFSGRPGIYDVLEEERFWLLIQTLQTASIILYSGLLTWLTLAALAIHRDRPSWAPSCRWPAACESCGYALVGMNDEQGCPECGRIVGTSTRTDRRPIQGKPWSVMASALTRPATIGRRLLVRRQTNMPTRTFLLGLLLVVLSGPVGVIFVQIANGLHYGYGTPGFFDLVEDYLLAGLMAGFSMMPFAVLIALGAGSICGLCARVFGRRNAMVGSCKAMCLASGLLPIWSLSNFLMVAFFILADDWLDGLFDHLFIEEEFLYLGLMLGLNAMMLVLLLIVTGRIERASRHANE